jgi:hypothetical protein
MSNYETSFTNMWHICNFGFVDPSHRHWDTKQIQSAIGILVWMWNGVQGLLLLGKPCARKVHPQFQRYDILLKYDAVLRPLMGVHSRIDCRCCPKIMAADTLPIGIPLGGR